MKNKIGYLIAITSSLIYTFINFRYNLVNSNVSIRVYLSFIGALIGTAAIPFIITLIIFRSSKRKNLGKIFGITCVVIYLIAGFSNYAEYKNLKTIEKEKQVIVRKDQELIETYLKEITSEVITQRRKYLHKIDSIGVVNITKEEDTKDIVLLNKIKKSINSQKRIEDWNYSMTILLFNKYKTKLEEYQKKYNISKKRMDNLMPEEIWNNSLKLVKELKPIQNDYFFKYNNLINLNSAGLKSKETESLVKLIVTRLFHFNNFHQLG